MFCATKTTSMMFKCAILTALFAGSMMAIPVSGHQFEVGEERGWKRPNGKEPETYNEWAVENRFHIGDTLSFKYQNDSVLVVDSANYLQCNTSNPISKFENGNTVFQFDHSGFFYFISGVPGHCKSGQRLIVRVMHPSELESPEPAPSPQPGGGPSGDSGWFSDEWGPPGVNSTNKLMAMSYFMTAVACLFVVFYLFI